METNFKTNFTASSSFFEIKKENPAKKPGLE